MTNAPQTSKQSPPPSNLGEICYLSNANEDGVVVFRKAIFCAKGAKAVFLPPRKLFVEPFDGVPFFVRAVPLFTHPPSLDDANTFCMGWDGRDDGKRKEQWPFLHFGSASRSRRTGRQTRMDGRGRPLCRGKGVGG